MPQDFFQFYCPTKIISCAGIAREFSAELEALGITKALVVTDKMLAELKVIDPVLEGLKNAGVAVSALFTEVPANSEVKAVKRCAEAGAKQDVDGVIAIGGGSVIDTAKGAAILLTHGGDLVRDYSGAETLPGALKPLVAIPTTAGTGSEVTHAAVILDEESHTKLSFVDRHLAPSLAVLDPELTVGLPPKLTAATAMDALTHAIESFTSIQANPFSEAMASEAIPLIRQNLLKAVLHGEDLDARSGLLTAAALAGIAFDHAMVGVVHGMSHATGGIVGVHHGTANSIFLPWGMEYNLAVCADKYAQIAGLLGVKTAGLTDEAAARKAIEAVIRLREELNQACGLPTRLKDAGVREDQLEAIAEGAVNDGTSFYNPRDVVKEEVLEAVRKAY
ncbi:MAG TPA: iron-containing alcohol dehydrogenase [bacterium]|nr:iron-containing alcohol dehydrogenase [bacterium]